MSKKLIRLRESIFLSPGEHPQIIPDKDLPANLRERTEQEISIETQLQKLWEDSSFRSTFPNKELFDKVSQNILREAAANTKKTYKFPIARYGYLNNNKRIYTRKLWENVINRQKESWQGLCGLADHPKEDADPGEWKYSSIVWLDMQIGDNGLVCGIGRFVGPYGALAQDIIDAGGRVGFSSSGFGDVNSLTKEVDPETYQLERVADIVLNPSQNVYGEQTNEANELRYSMNEKTEKSKYEKARDDAAKGVSLEKSREKHGYEAELAYADHDRIKILNSPAVKEAGPASKVAQKVLQQKQSTNQIGENKMKVDATLNEATAEKVVDTSVSSALTKAEEKAFRKYVESFMADASDIKNPAQRLKEMAEILSMFNDGVAGDLRERFEYKLVEERNSLEKLIEETVAAQEETGVESVQEIVESAKKIATEGVLLSENVEDYKMLVEGLTERNRKLIKENKALEIKLRLRENKIEKVEQSRNELKVGSDAHFQALLEELEDVKKDRVGLRERIQKLSESNKQLEKDNGLLTSKLTETRNAASKLSVEHKKQLKETSSSNETIKRLEETVKTYEGMIERLQEKNKRLVAERQDLIAEHDAFKQRVKEETNVSLHIQPSYKERVSGMLNFRENNGIEVENYWQDQLKKYGESVLPFEKQIRGAKTMREATAAFLRNREYIDPDFNMASNARITEGFIPVKKRAEILAEAGMDVTQSRSLDDANEEFLARAKAMGLK